MKKEHPSIFNSEMVRAILDGRKTQTRRVVKKRHIWCPDHETIEQHIDYMKYNQEGLLRCCPYGKVGDLLWVRENIRTICYPYQDGKFVYGEYLIEYMADKVWVKCPEQQEEWWRHNWRKRQSTTIPSIFMPKWATRIWLEVTGVRAERVWGISVEDCLTEGIIYQDGTEFWENGYIEAFKTLWDSINAKRGFGWDKNPFVWVREFKKVAK